VGAFIAFYSNIIITDGFYNNYKHVIFLIAVIIGADRYVIFKLIRTVIGGKP